MKLSPLKGRFIKHKRAKDVCYLVKDIKRYNGVTRYKLEIWNMGFEDSWYLQDCKCEDIILEDFQFTNYSSHIDGCLRYADWQEINFV